MAAVPSKSFRDKITQLENNNPNLTRLNLGYSCKFTEADAVLLANALQHNTNLISLDIMERVSYNQVALIMQALQNNATLKRFRLSGACLGEKCVQSIVDALVVNKSLTSLDLGFNGLYEKLIIMLAKILLANPNLTTLRLSSNAHSFTLKAVTALFNAALAHKNLSKLYLSDTALNINSIKLIVGNINELPLTCLDLSHNKIKDEGAILIAKALKRNTTLIKLRLNCADIRIEGVKAIADALQDNTTLRCLDLAKNKFWNSGVLVIAKALEINRTLNELNLNGNSMWSEGVTALLAMLKENKILRTILVSGNKLHRDAIKKLKRALDRNCVLQMDSEEDLQRGVNELLFSSWSSHEDSRISLLPTEMRMHIISFLGNHEIHSLAQRKEIIDAAIAKQVSKSAKDAKALGKNNRADVALESRKKLKG